MAAKSKAQRVPAKARDIVPEPKQANKVTLDLAKLRDGGVFIQVTVRGMSLVKRQTSFSERGISAYDARRRLQTAGVTYTIPTEIASALHSLENKIRANLKRYAYDLNGFRPYQFLTWDAAVLFYKKHLSLCGEGDELVEKLITLMPEYRTKSIDTFKAVAESAWDSYEASTRRAGAQPVPKQPFIDNLIANAMAKIPSDDVIRQSFSFEYSVALAQLGSDMQRELEILNELDADRAETRARIVKANAEEWATNYKLRKQQFATDREKEVMKMMIAERVRDQLNNEADPFQDAVAELRGRMAGAAKDILDALNKADGKLTKSAEKKARGMIDLFKVMTLGTDDELLALIQKVDKAITPNVLWAVGEDLADKDIAKPLREIGDLVQSIGQTTKREVTNKTRAQRDLDSIE